MGTFTNAAPTKLQVYIATLAHIGLNLVRIRVFPAFSVWGGVRWNPPAVRPMMELKLREKKNARVLVTRGNR